MKPVKKFRPVLSESQIIYLLSRCKEPSELNKKNAISCIASLAPFLAKIENAGIIPAYSVSTPETLSDKLGYGSEPDFENSFSQEEKDKILYLAWVNLGQDSSKFSLSDLKRIHAYRYLNELMTSDEESEYAHNLMIGD